MRLLNHITVGTNDLAKSTAFYKSVMEALGSQLIGEIPDRTAMFGRDEGPEFFVVKLANGEPASFANGGTIGLIAQTRAQVDAFHAAGMAQGAQDEGAPGPRDFAPNAYAAYMRDLDGNKIMAACMAAE